MSAPRLAALLLISVMLTTVALVAAHGLWERSSVPSVRERVVLLNLATSVMSRSLWQPPHCTPRCS